jgi:hypothetical protein
MFEFKVTSESPETQTLRMYSIRKAGRHSCNIERTEQISDNLRDTDRFI